MNEISYRWQLRKLHRSRAKTVATYKHLQEKARKEETSTEKIESLISDEMFEVNIIDDEIETLESRYLTESARKFVLPIPEFGKEREAWEESTLTGHHRLTKQAMMALRVLVRKERKERREGAMLWLAALTGFIGALSGLLAVWKS